MSTYLTRTTHTHDVTVFKDSRIGCLHGNDNGAIFKNLHFETRFQNYAFSVNEQVKRIKSFLFLAENVVV